eukprot:Hpha_TRINITY_DN15820_c1_g17::TRINITY_DN15820_c1_g17_i1::g.187174::m.187174/K14840/NOP53, GLTSCR2; nucleolar protein 53
MPGATKRGRTEAETDEGLRDIWSEAVVPKKKKERLGGSKAAAAARTDKLRSAATRVPDAGQSYNPDKSAHRAVIEAAVQKLTKDEERQIRTAKELRASLHIKKTVVGDDIKGTDWDWEVEGDAPLPFRTPKRKTKTQRNKARREAEKMVKYHQKKRRNMVTHDADRIDEIKGELKAKAEKSAAKQAVKKGLRKGRTTLRVGRARFREKALDVCAEESLAGALRKQGSKMPGVRDALKLRYESFQQRSIVPAGKKTVKKHDRLTRYVAVAERAD